MGKLKTRSSYSAATALVLRPYPPTADQRKRSSWLRNNPTPTQHRQCECYSPANVGSPIILLSDGIQYDVSTIDHCDDCGIHVVNIKDDRPYRLRPSGGTGVTSDRAMCIDCKAVYCNACCEKYFKEGVYVTRDYHTIELQDAWDEPSASITKDWFVYVKYAKERGGYRPKLALRRCGPAPSSSGSDSDSE